MNRIYSAFALLIFFLFSCNNADNQQPVVVVNSSDRLADTIKINELLALAKHYDLADSLHLVLALVNEAVSLSQHQDLKKFNGLAHSAKGNYFTTTGEYIKGAEEHIFALRIFEELNDLNEEARCFKNLGMLYDKQHNLKKSLENYKHAYDLKLAQGDSDAVFTLVYLMGIIYGKYGNDSLALMMLDSAKKYSLMHSKTRRVGECDLETGFVFLSENNLEKSVEHFENACTIFTGLDEKEGMARCQHGMAKISLEKGNPKEALDHESSSMAYFGTSPFIDYKLESLKTFSEIYSRLNDYPNAYAYLKRFTVVRDSLRIELSGREIGELMYQHNLDNKQLEMDWQKKNYLTLISGSVILLLLFIGLFYQSRSHNKEKEKQNLLLSDYNEKLEQALFDLKKTQTQLVQQEKLASLGQLTAGVAHEINNPINFVSSSIPSVRRNFEDIKTLIAEYEKLTLVPEEKIKMEKLKQQLDIAASIEETDTLLKGISVGASRTSEIVKGLKNFSRTDEHEMRLSEINEGIESTVLLLSKKIVQKNILIEKKLSPIPQLFCFAGQLNQLWMNLLANALDAVDNNGKITISSGLSSTRQFVVVSVKDNGKGMTDEVKQKIFDPFFTTKDVGQGTGLGLSIAFGIVEKHKGKIEVFSKPGEGTEFKISIPFLEEDKKSIA